MRTRGDAQSLIEKGRVRVNRQRVKHSSKTVRPGDMLTIALDARVRVVKVLASAEKRGGADQARELFEEEDGAVLPRS